MIFKILIISFFCSLYASSSIDVFPNFSDDMQKWNSEITENYMKFQEAIKKNPVFKNQPTVVDYLAYLTGCLSQMARSQILQKTNLANVINYVCATGGPFGISQTQGTPLQLKIMRDAIMVAKVYGAEQKIMLMIIESI